MSDHFKLGGRSFRSRLILGTGKYESFELMHDVIAASETEMVSVQILRVELDRTKESMLDFLDQDKYTLLPSTAGCYEADDAVRAALLGREAGFGDLVKLEVIGDSKTLYPDTAGLLDAAETLIGHGFTVLPYTSDDPVVARRLEELGCAAVMPLAAPVGSGLGICNPYAIQLIRDAVSVPVIVDAGVGTASDATLAMEMGVEGVLVNTGIAHAKNPRNMARAMKAAVEAGRLAYLSGRIPKRLDAQSSSSF